MAGQSRARGIAATAGLDPTRPGALTSRARWAARLMLVWFPERLTAPQRRFLVDVLAGPRLLPEAAVRVLAVFEDQRQREARDHA